MREGPKLSHWLICLDLGQQAVTLYGPHYSAGYFVKALLPPGKECWGYDGLATPFPVPGGSDLCHQPITSYPENDVVPSGFLTSPFALPRSLSRLLAPNPPTCLNDGCGSVISAISLCPPLSSSQVFHWLRILLCWKYELWAPSVRRGIPATAALVKRTRLLMPFGISDTAISSEPPENLLFARPITQCDYHRLQLFLYLPLRIYPFRPSSQPDPSKTGWRRVTSQAYALIQA
ncbi:hypothetical protein BDQ94DRAFT_163407 [Aspergillus welwitschiae]|uniref:Uncharacterized protein n=1 Tax=Aspergillus welwitschiae TaxID=1341132 RepID=A0A3F3PLL2_9EURO|nr:hypothetical protein BDQ94DRAFT_163407 [Aspergillus welwitschiae]RDH27713.1 hypothetical protein BDQ94DRAFT_163407 [Aspergillus welwitschiae]